MTEYALLQAGSKNHFYASRANPVTLGVIHTAEVTPSFQGNPNATDNLVRWAQSTPRTVSWHDTSGHDKSVPMLPFTHTAFHVRGYNSRSVGDEIATRAGLWAGAPANWVEDVLASLVLATSAWVKEFDLPIRRITKAQADAGLKGFVAHGDLDPGRRTDPGINFPWNTFLAQLGRHLLEPVAPAPAPPENSVRTKTPGLLQFGDAGPDVRAWQRRLLAWNNRSLPVFGADSDFGGETHSATREFQKFARITDDGIVGGQSRDAMQRWENNRLNPTIGASLSMPAWSSKWGLLRNGSSGSRTRTWQRAINAWRPRTLVADGQYGPVTARATVSFQRDQRLGVDGVVGAQSWNRMRSLVR